LDVASENRAGIRHRAGSGLASRYGRCFQKSRRLRRGIRILLQRHDNVVLYFGIAERVDGGFESGGALLALAGIDLDQDF
jgi:hypothetical protein